MTERDQIIHRVIPWAGSAAAAEAWYCTQMLPSFGKRPEQLVQEGSVAVLLRHLERVSEGGFT